MIFVRFIIMSSAVVIIMVDQARSGECGHRNRGTPHVAGAEFSRLTVAAQVGPCWWPGGKDTTVMLLIVAVVKLQVERFDPAAHGGRCSAVMLAHVRSALVPGGL
ncbi:uncharacterized protein V1518DRAFT_412771 [Limtongia smithiae]|uniref:uncharacterized protein n=1 Tax=Limtongia smithiae TaxID=1125753 RepID=UPI0034D000ED